MKKITWCIFFICFILFRPYQLQNSGMVYSGDDYSYMAHATSLVFFQFPSYEKEYFTSGKNIPLHSIGPSLLAAPFVFLTSLVDRASGQEIVLQRTALNITGSWTAFGFTLASIFYLWMTCLLLYKGLMFYFQPRIVSLTVILTVLLQGIPLFAFRRPVFSHIYEIFLQSLSVFLLLRLSKCGGFILSKERLMEAGEAICVGLLSGLIILVRLNNILIALAWPVILFSLYYPRISRLRIARMIAFSYVSAAALFFIFQIGPIIYNFRDIHQYSGYLNNEYIKKYLLTLYGPFFYIKRLGHLLWGIDWGLIFTAPYVLLGLFFIPWIRKEKITKCLIWLLCPLVVNLYITLSFRNQGDWYGYRYFIFSIIPIAVYPMARLMAWTKSKGPFFYYMIIGIAVIPMLSMISFEGNDGNLTLKLMDQGAGFATFGNTTYQLEIYKTILTRPLQYFFVMLKGGPAYLSYLAATFTGCQKHLPMGIYEKYVVFQLPILFKTILIYLFPFALLFIFKMPGIKKKGNS